MKKTNQTELISIEEKGSSIFERSGSLAKKNNPSVRTTFLLSKQVHEDFRSYAKSVHLDVKDLISEEIEYWISFIEECFPDNESKSLYEKIDNHIQTEPVKKTYVLTKTALTKLNEKSTKFNVSRDKLVERVMAMGIKTSRKFTEQVTEKKARVKQVFLDIYKHDLEKPNPIVQSLPKDDWIRIRYQYILNCMSKLVSDIEKEINTGEEIDPTDY